MPLNPDFDPVAATRAAVGALAYDELEGGNPLDLLLAECPCKQGMATAGAYMLAKFLLADLVAQTGVGLREYIQGLGLRLAQLQPEPTPSWHPSCGC